MSTDDEYLRAREILFCTSHAESDPAQLACELLQPSTLILGVRKLSPWRLLVRYDVRKLSYAELERALDEKGFMLNTTLLAKLRSALYQYNEDVIRTNLGISSACISHCARKVFINNYHHHTHGCKDQRARHWREYL